MLIISKVPEFITINNHFQWKDSRQRRSAKNKVLLSLVVLLGLLSLCKVSNGSFTSLDHNSSYGNQSSTQTDEQECLTEEVNSTVVYVEFSSKIVKNGT